jgi:hypothetical protein
MAMLRARPTGPLGYMHLQIAFLFPKLSTDEEKAIIEKRLKELGR